ncbi:hypothetical protein BGW39_011734 [Mortierella sp. 14UC]|nr:hypothetical protein BGW39_011734 [Mortierella sp. 14UC]
MELWDLHSQEEQELLYLRDTYARAANLWMRDDLDQNKQHAEGWYLWKLHGPLMEIFSALPNVQLSATDLRARNNGFDDKHDILVRHTVYPIDVIVVEAKKHKQKGPREIDSDKIARTMTATLNKMLEQVPQNARDRYRAEMRSYGILNSGLGVALLEARFMDEIPVVYFVRQFEVPAGALVCHEFVQGLVFMIAFKNLVRDFLNEYSQILSNTTPTSSPGHVFEEDQEEEEEEEDDDDAGVDNGAGAGEVSDGGTC